MAIDFPESRYLRGLVTIAVAGVLLLVAGPTDASAHHGPSGVSSALDNGTIRVGIDLAAGGSISYLSQSGSPDNLVNVHDKGRYVQPAFYAGQGMDRTSEGQSRQWSPWPWNPVQAGDAYGNSAPVLAWSNDGQTIYVRTRPLLWDMKGEACQCDFETWISLEGATVRVRVKLTTFRTDSRWDVERRPQELPAVYTIADLNRVLTYTGGRPFTGDWITQISETPSFWEQWRATEHWAACVNDQNFGVGVYSSPRTFFLGGLYGSSRGGQQDSSTCYLAPVGWSYLDKSSNRSYRYFLTVGTVGQIRHTAYALDRRFSDSSRSPDEQDPF